MMKLDRRIREGAVIQGNDKAKGFCGCTMIVDKVTAEGVKCYMRLPFRGDDTAVLPYDAVEYIGEAAYSLPN